MSVKSTTHKEPIGYITGQDKHHTIISEDKGITSQILGEGTGKTPEESQKNASKDYENNKK